MGNSGTDWYQADSTYQLSEQISWSHGSHNIVAGAEFRRLATSREATNSPRGSFHLQRNTDRLCPARLHSRDTATFSTPGPEVHGHVAEWRDGFFVQQVAGSRKLTLNYGLRYELPTVAYTVNGNATELNATQTAIVGGAPRAFTPPTHTSDWAPRLGFAYRIDDKTVFRGGGGIYYNPNQTTATLPEQQSAVRHDPDLHLVGHSHAGEPERAVRFRGGMSTSATAGTIATDRGTSRRRVRASGARASIVNCGAAAAWSLGYLGSHSYHLDRSYYNNTPLPGPVPRQPARPNPLFGVIRTIATDEIANYEGLTVVFRQRMSHGLQTLASYSWSAHAGRQLHGLQRRRRA